MLNNKFKVAISTDFMDSFSRIPKKEQARVAEFMRKFRENPTATGIHFEKIKNGTDPNLRSVGMGNTYRGIVLKPQKGNLYMLLWVDHHDEAYKWAERKVVNINPATGSLQVYVADNTMAPAAVTPEEQRTGLFREIRDKHLIQLGIPEVLLPAVRRIDSDEDLDQIEKHLPSEAFEALYLLAAGYSLEETFRELEKNAQQPEAQVDTEDFEAALENIDSKRRFVVVEDDQTLQDILNAPLDQWRVFLHPSQRKIVDKAAYNGPVRVLGGAGTGKTVVAMHRARKLAEEIFTQPRDRILFTTFTKNLADDIFENLKKICSVEVLQKIEVVNLDRWVANFLRKNNWNFDLAFGNHETKMLWENAFNLMPNDVDLPQAFYKDEWENVIQAQGVKTMADYFKASRLGRGRRLSRLLRKKIWPVFEEYRAQLNGHNKKEFTDAVRDALAILREKGDVLPYRAVVVDEAQDMSAAAFELIRQIVPEGKNDIFIVGDAHQRIYGHKIVLSHCGLNIRGRSRKLRINYRTTDEIRHWAVALLEGRKIDDLDGGADDNKGYRSLMHGEAPEIKNFDCYEQEIEFIKHRLGTLRDEGLDLRNVCLVTRTSDMRDQYRQSLESAGFDVYTVMSKASDQSRHGGVRLATMHRVKGLEFDVMIIAGVNEGIIPLIYPDLDAEGNEFAVEEHETKERSLLYVAATRAKKDVLITSSGQPSRLIV
jgi:superfamily I DNA/RNA helicase/mRNA-degrading endonuclease RelE of RelBE toxin-antitoxin system